MASVRDSALSGDGGLSGDPAVSDDPAGSDDRAVFRLRAPCWLVRCLLPCWLLRWSVVAIHESSQEGVSRTQNCSYSLERQGEEVGEGHGDSGSSSRGTQVRPRKAGDNAAEGAGGTMSAG